MAPLTRSRHLVHLIPLATLLFSFVLSLGTVVAAAPAVAANPALVPFDVTPGKPGTTQLTFVANGTTGLTACGQDNGNLPTFKIGSVDPATPLTLDFPFIQAGVYTFWVGTDPACGVVGKLAQATATRVGPTGKAGKDDIGFLPNYGDQSIAPNRQYPMPGEQLCIMSGDGKTVPVSLVVGQDVRLFGAGAATTTVTPFAGQNGCYDVPWIVTGYYGASIVRSGTSTFLGFCLSAFPPNGTSITPPPNPVGSPPVAGGGAYHCAKIAYEITTAPNAFPVTSLTTTVPAGSVLTGAAMTGANNHAIQTCFYSAVPTGGGGGIMTPHGVQSFNGSGAMNLTPLTLNFPSKSYLLLATYDVTGSAPGGIGGTVRICPSASAVFNNTGGVDSLTLFADPSGMNLLDRRFIQIS